MRRIEKVDAVVGGDRANASRRLGRWNAWQAEKLFDSPMSWKRIDSEVVTSAPASRMRYRMNGADVSN